MISRSLGPEFGGSIGLMFFLAKVCACGEYVLGLVEAILDVFGSDPGTLQYIQRVKLIPAKKCHMNIKGNSCTKICITKHKNVSV